MTFPYRRQRRGNDIRYLPLVPIDLRVAKRHIRVRALIDSGAEHTVFSQQIAHELGIDPTAGREVTLQGVGGIVPGHLASIDLQFGVHRWTTNAIFSDGVAAGTGLLGQLGFFEFFAVTFLYSRREITIRRARTHT